MTHIQLLNHWNDMYQINSYLTGNAYCFLVDRHFGTTSIWRPNEPLAGCAYWRRNDFRLVGVTSSISRRIRRDR